ECLRCVTRGIPAGIAVSPHRLRRFIDPGYGCLRLERTSAACEPRTVRIGSIGAVRRGQPRGESAESRKRDPITRLILDVGLPAEVARYLFNDCVAVAIAVARLTGRPVAFLVEDDSASWSFGPVHAAVAYDSRYVDASGIVS